MCRLVIGSLVAVLTVAPAWAGCCSGLGRNYTLRQQAAQARFIFVGTLTRCFDGANGDKQKITEVAVGEVIRPHALLGDRKVIEYPREVQIDPKKPLTFVLFGDSYKGKLDLFGAVDAKPALIGYLKGALALDTKDQAKEIQYFAGFLDHSDREIARDALTELTNIDRPVLLKEARKFDPATLRKVLARSKTDASLASFCALCLGVCGSDRDADFLQARLDKASQDDMGIVGTFEGLVLLRPRVGWERVRQTLGDPKTSFIRRYAAFRTARSIWADRPNLIGRKNIAATVGQLLPQDDIADLAMEELRKWERWEFADEVFRVSKLESHQIPIVRRSAIRYALGCKHLPSAAAFLAQARAKDAAQVQDIEEILALETKPAGKPKE